VTLILICLYIFYEAYQRILDPHPVQGPGMLAIAFIGLVANVAAILVLEKGESLNVRSAFLHVLGDTLSSAGIIVGGLVMLVTGWYIIDPIISVLIALLVLVSAYRVTTEAVNILLEATPSDIALGEVVEAVKEVDGVRDMHDVHIWSITSGLHALSAHLLIDDQLTSCSTDIVGRVQSLLEHDFGIAHTTLQCECDYCVNGEMVCALDRPAVAHEGHRH
jgi:cobalt-zinc-cadmium efflux system protein